jgi:hypothetical protein
MAKKIFNEATWIKTLGVDDVYSISGCMSKDFTDYINYRKHNGYWPFDSLKVIKELAEDHSLDLARTKFFYYEVYELEFDEDKNEWRTFGPEVSSITNVAVPKEKHLEGFDVVTFSGRTSPECSPLSCNSLAREIEVNRHSLLISLEEAKQSLESGKFKNSEPGPYRIFAVYSLEKSLPRRRDGR